MEIKKDIAKSDSVGFDETMHKDNGMRRWITVAHANGMYCFEISNSRATRLLDGMDYKGIAITNMYPGYKRYDEWGKHQCCWAHVLQYAKHLFEKDDPTLLESWRERRRECWEDLAWFFERGKLVVESGAHSQVWREQLEGMLAYVLDWYGGTDDDELEEHVRMMERHLHGMSAFVEHPGVEPTNNASERALRYYAILCKVIGQTGGGARAMRRLGDFVSCAWWSQGKSVMAEVAKLI